MFYLVWCLPLLPVLAVSLLLHFATASSNALDPVQKMAQIQTLVDAADQRAAGWDLRAQLSLKGSVLQLQLSAGAQARLDSQQALSLGFVHPTDAKKDHWLTLLPSATRTWQAPRALLPDLAHVTHWRLRLVPMQDGCTPGADCLAAARWQLYGNYAGAQSLDQALPLLPRFGAP